MSVIPKLNIDLLLYLTTRELATVVFEKQVASRLNSPKLKRFSTLHDPQIRLYSGFCRT